VNAVAPGYIASSGMDHYPPEAGPMLREMRQTVPLGRFGNEAETSAAIVFLLSPGRQLHQRQRCCGWTAPGRRCAWAGARWPHPKTCSSATR
jgi:NAD(P)-dependent dehydrogenase (short-subunit alcohol dehydrogenase family)